MCNAVTNSVLSYRLARRVILLVDLSAGHLMSVSLRMLSGTGA